MHARQTVNVIDLFAGAGGLSQGFRQASSPDLAFSPLFAVESEPSFAASYAANFGDHVFSGRIEDLRRSDLPLANVDVVIGGPPCQGFSPLGRMYPTDEHLDLNGLWRYFFKVVAWVMPRVFVIENVPAFLGSQQYLEARRTAVSLGYTVVEGVLNAADFEVPQVRRRGFVIGSRVGPPSLPSPRDGAQRRTVRDAIEGFMARKLVTAFDGRMRDGTFRPHLVRDLHLGRNPTPKSLVRYTLIPEGGNRFDLIRTAKGRRLAPQCWIDKAHGSTDVFGRLWWNRPAVTIRTQFFKPEKGRYLHPVLDRPITHLEAAALQTFPESYKFCGSKIQIARQIGNAVPPRLAEAVARVVRDLLLGRIPKANSRAVQLDLMVDRAV